MEKVFMDLLTLLGIILVIYFIISITLAAIKTFIIEPIEKKKVKKHLKENLEKLAEELKKVENKAKEETKETVKKSRNVKKKEDK